MKLYLRYLSIHVRSQMQYKSSFLMLCLGQFLVSFSAFLGMYFLFSRFHQVAGFTLPEVMLCFSTVLMAFSLAECFARGFDTFASVLGDGTFDRILLRPRSAILQVLGQKIEISRIGRFAQALIMLAYALPMSGVTWTAGRVATLLYMIAGGMVMFASLFMVYAALCFFTTEGLEVMNILTDGGREFGSYPVVIYGRAMLGFFTCVVPLAMFQYYPLLFLLGRTQSVLYALAPTACFAFALPCYGLFRLGMRHYKSTGS